MPPSLCSPQVDMLLVGYDEGAGPSFYFPRKKYSLGVAGARRTLSVLNLRLDGVERGARAASGYFHRERPVQRPNE
jgi:hypothetical protein